MSVIFSSSSVKLFYSFLILIQAETHILLVGFFISNIYSAGKTGKGENYLLSSPKAIEGGKTKKKKKKRSLCFIYTNI